MHTMISGADADVLVLLSGGVDSALLLWQAQKPAALFVDWCQPASHQERAACMALAKARGCSLYGASADLCIGAMGAESGEPGPRVVPARNLALIASAVNLAATLGIARVEVGAQASDAAAYPDCRTSFFEPIRRVVSAAYGVEVVAPMVTTPRADVVRIARAIGVPLGLCWSCYSPLDGRPCKTCNSCRQER